METTRPSSVRDNIANTANRTKTEIHAHPAKWTGVAIGAGIGAGLLSRYLLHRRFHHS